MPLGNARSERTLDNMTIHRVYDNRDFRSHLVLFVCGSLWRGCWGVVLLGGGGLLVVGGLML